MDAGLLIARLVLGLSLSGHAVQKLFGWLAGHGLRGTGAFFDGLGFRPGVLFALAAGLGELGGGTLTTVGLFGPVGPALIILVMLVAMVSVHWSHGFFASSDGIELPLLYMTAALALAFAGPGAYSVDGLVGFATRPQPVTAWIAVAVAAGAALANLAVRRHAPAQESRT
jgi:putative oxidoreductase